MTTSAPLAELAPRPLVPRASGPRLAPLAAQRLLERYRVLAMALATRAIAAQWDTGLIGARKDSKLAAPDEPALPYEPEVLGLIGVSRGLAPDHVREAERGVAQAAADVEAAEAEAGAPTPLGVLCAEFGLGPMERMLLLLVAAPQLWGSVHQLYRVAHNDPLRTTVDEYLLQAMLGSQVNPHLVARALDRSSPLARYGLIVADEGGLARPLRPLRVDSLILERLRGGDLDADPEGAIPLVAPGRPLGELTVDPSAAAQLARWAMVDQPGTRLVLRGRRASGRTTLAAGLAAGAGRRLARIDLLRLPEVEHDPARALARALARCLLAGWVPLVTGFDVRFVAEREARERVGAVLDEHPGPVILRLAPEDQPVVSPGYRMIELPTLSETARLAMWQAELTRHDLAADGGADAALAARWRLGPGAICRVVADAARARPAPGEVGAEVERAVAQHLLHGLSDVAERITKLPSLADMVLPPDILDSLTEFVARTRLARQVYEEWGLGRVATTGQGLTALFQGAPGTGKTMVAGALARELDLDLYRVDLSRVMSKWIGETERNLASVFAAAEEGHAIILFDEADSLFTKRTEVKSSNDRHANVEVNYLLQRLDSFVGIAILTTNFGTAIDPAFKRRLSFRITFPIPDEELREELWRRHLPATLPIAGDLDLADLARRYDFAGGAVRNCALRAAFLAAAEGKPLSQDHLQRAIRLEYRSVGKLAEGGPLE
ncbi:MAG: ATP-binding protein [Kofleriaceae bacterium]|jgi:hypothetical protein|nr:ATP-binding protein [Kofleriaceae bacterium]MBP9165919.1 ATP-binding protein [Kofleriaceae bacterium]MBP9857578.1 ATP-binding protein [Kofleriaceae bacterium]